MSERQRRFFTAPTLDRALIEAAGYLGIPVEDVAYQEVPKKTGLARGRGVTIRIDRATAPADEEALSGAEAQEATAVEDTQQPSGDAAVERVEAAEDSEPAERVEESPAAPQARSDESPVAAEDEASAAAAESPPRPADAGGESSAAPRFPGEVPRGERIEFPAGPEDLVATNNDPDNEITRSAARWIEAILDLADLDAEARVEEREGPLVWLDLAGPDEDFLLEDSGQLLQAIQHLMPRLMQSDLGRVVPCVADSGGFREFHGERLRVQAVGAAEEVRRNGRAVALEPMNPPDRREVHLALADDPAVDTESSGRGYFKRITVRPT